MMEFEEFVEQMKRLPKIYGSMIYTFDTQKDDPIQPVIGDNYYMAQTIRILGPSEDVVKHALINECRKRMEGAKMVIVRELPTVYAWDDGDLESSYKGRARLVIIHE